MTTLSLPPGYLTAEQLHALLSELLAPFAAELGFSLEEVVTTVEAPHVLEAAKLLHDDLRLAFDYLRSLSGVDWPDRFEVVYTSTRRSTGIK